MERVEELGNASQTQFAEGGLVAHQLVDAHSGQALTQTVFLPCPAPGPLGGTGVAMSIRKPALLAFLIALLSSFFPKMVELMATETKGVPLEDLQRKLGMG